MSNENTRERILEVASQLFLTKGYEQTRISDIIKGLDGLTKGAIYHHFDSKEDIFNTVIDEIGHKNIAIFDAIKADPKLNGAEKLREMIGSNFKNENMNEITSRSPNLLDNPKLLASFISEIRDITIPRYLGPIIHEGVADGSIQTDYPEELAEMIALLLNMWLNPLIFESETCQLANKMRVLNGILERYGLKLFGEDLIKMIGK